jgi:hypothetical protein
MRKRDYDDPRTSADDAEDLKPKLDVVKKMFPQKLAGGRTSKTN